MTARVGLGLVGFALFLAVWESMLWLGIASDRVVAFPSTLYAFLASRPALGDLWHATLVSAWQFATGFGIASAIALVMGVGLGWYRWLGAQFEPILAATNAVPLIAVIPLLVIILGLGPATELIIIGMFAFFPLYFAVSSAAADVDLHVVRMCRSFGGGEWQVLTGIVLPSVIPAIVSGLRLGIGRALTALVVVELFMGRGGLGSTIIDSVNQGKPNLALLAVVILGTANLVASGLLRSLQGRVEAWRPAPAKL